MDALRARIRAQSKTVADQIAADPEAQGFIDDWTTPLSWLARAPGRRLCRPRPSPKWHPPPPFRQPEAPLRWPQLMTVNPETLEKLGRFLLRGLRIGASSATPAAGRSPARLWCAPANRRQGAHRSRRHCCRRSRCAGGRHRATAPNGADHTPRLLLLLAYPGLQRLAQVSARLQPQRHHLHGFGPSTRPWIITKASI